MARPHIEFIHAQQLAWEKDLLPGPLGELDCKILSMDTEDGSCSVLLRYPAGWNRNDTAHLSAAQEFFVLDGALEINDQRYGLDCYAYLPAGFTRHGVASPGGAVALTFFDALPVTTTGEGSMIDDPNAPAIPFIDLHETPWDSEGIDPDVMRDRYMAHKRLRYNPATGDTTFVLEGGAHSHSAGWEEKPLYHPCVEEMYLLSGNIIGPQGVINGGGYFWRPPDIWHGPFVSRMGYLGVFRFLGGHHVNVWGGKALPATLTPDHNPVLPEELKAIAGQPHVQTPF